MNELGPIQLILLATTGLTLLLLLAFIGIFLLILPLWLRCFLAGAKVTIYSIIGSRLRRTPTKFLVDAYLAMHHRGKGVRFSTIESCYLAYPSQPLELEAFIEAVLKFDGKQPEQNQAV